MLKKLHHVAYRCKDAKQTVEFYTKMLDLKYNASVSNDRVPSTQEFYPHLHVFFEMEDGSYIAFFETPTAPDMAPRDKNTPEWVQHLALEVADVTERALALVPDRRQPPSTLPPLRRPEVRKRLGLAPFAG